MTMMTRVNKFRSVRGMKRLCEMIGPVGAIACAVVCLGLPAVSGALSVLGMKAFRDDRLLIPFEGLCCAVFLWSFERGRQVHGKFIVMGIALLAAGTFMGSMLLAGARSKAAVVFACVLLTLATVLNRRLLKRCLCVSHPSAKPNV